MKVHLKDTLGFTLFLHLYVKLLDCITAPKQEYIALLLINTALRSVFATARSYGLAGGAWRERGIRLMRAMAKFV